MRNLSIFQKGYRSVGFPISIVIWQSHHFSGSVLGKKQDSLVVESHVPGVRNIFSKQVDLNIFWNIQVELVKLYFSQFTTRNGAYREKNKQQEE